ncbi:MAG: GNAT family N-acetyltransferase [Thermomicrobiales bacterium]
MPESIIDTPKPDAAKDDKPTLIGADKQTFLVGEAIYLRPLNDDDAATGTSWRHTVFPQSTGTTEGWIEEHLAKGDSEEKETFAIVRRSDNLVVGSLVLEYEHTLSFAVARIDPIYGDTGQAWKAEAILLIARWQVFERHKLNVHTDIAGNETATIAALVAGGMRETARFREAYLRGGQRVDWVVLDFPHPKWVARLGDPLAIELPRTGTGEPRPVPAKGTLASGEAPPRGAKLLGQRVYLRPFVKDDADQAAIWEMRDPEADFSLGRGAESPATFARKALEEQKQGDWPTAISYMVCLRETDEPIGWVSLEDIDWVARTAETASWLFRHDLRGGGYGSEAKHLLLEHAFNHLRLHMVHSWVLFNNTRSAAALRKQGYTEAGRATWCFPYKGNLGNMVVFDLLADEWRALPRE